MKEQGEKSELHVAAQPKNMEKNSVQLIMLHDIAGYGTNEIAEALEMTASRVSIIKGSPLYQEQRSAKLEELKTRVIEGTAKQIIEDPARKVLADAKEECARMKVELALRGKSEFVRNAATSEVLSYNGIIPVKKQESEQTTTIVMEEKLAKRFGFAKEYSIEKKVTITQNVQEA